MCCNTSFPSPDEGADNVTFKRVVLFLILSAFIWTALFHDDGGPAPDRVQAQRFPVGAADEESERRASPVPASDGQTPSCATPTPALLLMREELAARILAATVRLELRFWEHEYGKFARQLDGFVSHGTIKDGRYLVTHNHFGPALERRRLAGQTATVTVYTASGEALLRDFPFEAVEIAYTDGGTMVLDFGAYGKQGVFAIIGLPSAEFEAWYRLPLQPGTEVAQIDWNGTVTHVDWTYVEAIDIEGETPTLQLPNFVRPGASGGGIFWQGRHVGNNWYRATELNGQAEVTRRYSRAALNPTHIGGLIAQ